MSLAFDSVATIIFVFVAGLLSLGVRSISEFKDFFI